MSDLLNQASLVMVPSGYKEDTVYSVVPSDGSGDLSFTRASNGTRVNSAGLVEVCPWNLVEYSEDFAQAPPIWNKYQATITSNTTTAPNGTLTADLITDNSANDVHIAYQDRAGIVAGTYTISVYAKASTLSHINLQWYDGTTPYTSNAFNLSNGTTTGANQSIESVGNGWYRCIFTFTTTVSGTQYAYVMLNNGTSNVYVGTGSGAVYIWGAQLNIGSTAKPYFPTTDRLNVPRLTYQNGGGGCPSLLLEKQSTNELLYSEQFDNAGWSKEAATSTANQTTSPDGTQNADTFIDNSVNSRHIFYQQFNGNLATARTFSLYAKQNSLRYLFMSVTNTGDTHCYSAIFDLQSGTVSATKVNGDATISASIVSAGNGWYRCIISGTMTTGTGNYFPLIGTSNRAGFTGSLYANNTPEYSGSGQSIYLWGAQLEASSYSTSYISTTSSSATRVADACLKTGISSLIGTDFTLFYDGFESFGGDYSRYVVLKGSGGTYINYVAIEGNTSNRISCAITDGSGASVFSAVTSSFTNGQRVKIALRCKNNDFAFYANGSLISSQASGSVPTTSDLYLGYYVDYTDNYNVVNQLAIFNQTLTNAELASLTTI